MLLWLVGSVTALIARYKTFIGPATVITLIRNDTINIASLTRLVMIIFEFLGHDYVQHVYINLHQAFM